VVVRKTHLIEALARVTPSISEEELDSYEELRYKFTH